MGRPGVRWQIAILLCLITTINYLDRQAFAVAGPVLLAEFGLTNTEFGFIASAFLVFYGVGHLVAGPFIDRVGTKRAFSIAVIAWSVAGILHAAGGASGASSSSARCSASPRPPTFPRRSRPSPSGFRADRSLAVGILTVGPGLEPSWRRRCSGIIVLTSWHWAFIARARGLRLAVGLAAILPRARGPSAPVCSGTAAHPSGRDAVDAGSGAAGSWSTSPPCCATGRSGGSCSAG